MFGHAFFEKLRAHEHRLERRLLDRLERLHQSVEKSSGYLQNRDSGYVKRSKKLSVIIEFEEDCFHEACREAVGLLNRHQKNRIRSRFPRIACCSAEITVDGLEELLSGCNRVKKVYLNNEVRALLDVAVVSANAKKVVRDGTELTGKGTTIAIVDTGIYPHKDLTGRIEHFVDFIHHRKHPYDDNGHGTHCAGDAASASARYAGPAPEAKLVGVKVLDRHGAGTLETVMQGVDWCIRHNEMQPISKIDIISLSIGTVPAPFPDENDDPMVKIVEEAWKAGIVVCAAAGNDGPERGTITSPGISDRIITVGALDDRDTPVRSDDDAAQFSGRGPTPYGVRKPDILAPGVDIVSLRSPGSYLDRTLKQNRVGADYFVLSGTSMATPICAGVVALMKQRDPSLTPDDVKRLLMEGADLWTGRDGNVYGAGYINADQAVP